MITALQSKMARVALDWGMRELAGAADVASSTVQRLEKGERLHERTLKFIRGVFEAHGIQFIDRDTVGAGTGEGVLFAPASAKSPMARLFILLWTVPNPHIFPNEAYSRLLEIAEMYLAIAANEGRVLTVWERLSLNDLVAALKFNQVFYALACIKHAITPPDNQSTDYPLRPEQLADAEALTTSYFDNCITALRERGFVDGYPEVTAGRLANYLESKEI